jgi:hypothetical protein
VRVVTATGRAFVVWLTASRAERSGGMSSRRFTFVPNTTFLPPTLAPTGIAPTGPWSTTRGRSSPGRSPL